MMGHRVHGLNLSAEAKRAVKDLSEEELQELVYLKEAFEEILYSLDSFYIDGNLIIDEDYHIGDSVKMLRNFDNIFSAEILRKAWRADKKITKIFDDLSDAVRLVEDARRTILEILDIAEMAIKTARGDPIC